MDLHGQPELFFRSLADDVITLDKKSCSFCNDHNKCDIKEVYDDQKYTLIASLQGFNENDIEVKIKHRVIFIIAEANKEYLSKFSYVRIIPNFVMPRKTTWFFENGELVVEIPYLDDVQIALNISCERKFDEDVIFVPKTQAMEAYRRRFLKIDYLEIFFQSLADDVISLDKKSGNFCRDLNTWDTKEVYDDQKYTIIAPLQGFNDNHIEVQIKHRVIFVNAKTNGEKSLKFSYVRIIPNFVIPRQASWFFENEELVVEIPYLKDVQVGLKISCVSTFDEEIIQVPKYPAMEE